MEVSRLEGVLGQVGRRVPAPRPPEGGGHRLGLEAADQFRPCLTIAVLGGTDNLVQTGRPGHRRSYFRTIILWHHHPFWHPFGAITL
jgi:hypothetical protein